MSKDIQCRNGKASSVSVRFNNMWKDEHLTITRYFYTVFVITIPVQSSVGFSEEQMNAEHTQQKQDG